jgi:hypothetical protein
VAEALAAEVARRTGFDQARAVRVLEGAVMSAIDAHGPLTEEAVPSAAKRAVVQFRADGLWRAAPS